MTQQDKEQSDFAKLKFQVGHILMQKFLEYNEGKFHTGLEMNPPTHALTEFIAEQLKQERNKAIDDVKNLCNKLGDTVSFTVSPISWDEFILELESLKILTAHGEQTG